MHFRTATKVGLAVVTSVAAFFAIWYFLIGQGIFTPAYFLQAKFPDAQNITEGAPVRMAGVQIGTVDEITLAADNQALLKLRIYGEQAIPARSRFVITAGGLIGEKYVSIIPSENETAIIEKNTTVQGQPTIQIEDLMAKASQLAGSADQVIQESRLALRDTRIAIRDLSRYVQDPRVKDSLLDSMRNAEIASANIARATRTADETARQFQVIVAGTEPGLNRTMGSVQRSAQNVEDLTGALNEIVAGEDIKSGLGATMNNMRLASEQLPVITRQMAAITANVEKFTGDPALAGNLQATTENLRVASEQARLSAEAINITVQRLTGRFTRPRPAGDPPQGTKGTLRTLARHSTLDLVQNFEPGHFHADVNTLFPFGENSFVRAGLYGLGEENRLNLQMGQSIDERWSARYGVYRGWLGLGLDQNLGQPTGFSVNLYRPNKPSLDIYARKRLNENTSIVVGAERIFQNPTPSIGVQIRR
ncbi:MAG: MCE family protein [Armatimonadetes bacterium]|nr:MCE family protein [Armatimonadota bacterium]